MTSQVDSVSITALKSIYLFLSSWNWGPPLSFVYFAITVRFPNSYSAQKGFTTCKWDCAHLCNSPVAPQHPQDRGLALSQSPQASLRAILILPPALSLTALTLLKHTGPLNMLFSELKIGLIFLHCFIWIILTSPKALNFDIRMSFPPRKPGSYSDLMGSHMWIP